MSLGSENGLSVADIAAVTDRNNGNCGNGWGGGFGEMLIAMIYDYVMRKLDML